MGKRGPQPKITPAIFDEIVNAVIAGGTQKQACAVVGIAHSTLWNYLKANPKLKDRLEAGREISNFGLVGVIYDLARGDEATKRLPDLRAAMFLLQRREGLEKLKREWLTGAVAEVVRILVDGIPKRYMPRLDRNIATLVERLQESGNIVD